MTPSIDRTLHQFLTITDLDLITDFDFYLIVQGFHRTYATGAACQQRTLTPPDTWPCPTLGLACVLMYRPISPELVLFPDLWISNTPRYFSFALSKWYDIPVGFVSPFWGSVLLYLRSPKGGCCLISDYLPCSLKIIRTSTQCKQWLSMFFICRNAKLFRLMMLQCRLFNYVDRPSVCPSVCQSVCLTSTFRLTIAFKFWNICNPAIPYSTVSCFMVEWPTQNELFSLQRD